MKLTVVWMLVVVGLLATGCGGSGKKAASATTTTTAATTAATTNSSAGSLPPFATTQNCARLRALGATFAHALQTSSANAQNAISTDAKAFQAMANAAPAEVHADFELIASAFNSYVQALSKARIKAGTVPTASQIAKIAAAAKAFGAPKLRAAEQRLAAWAQKNCGGTATTTTG